MQVSLRRFSQYTLDPTRAAVTEALGATVRESMQPAPERADFAIISRIRARGGIFSSKGA